ncbi:MAG: winged helix-turn-helix transcriptional regulator [Microthrixaceae bacterium]|nr:winged helix-turn-helix transcriptional regulator [Microthrixaceae bacterium]MCB1010503.1 winged helix-turn-helix transcriptional regulator [Microthrixaceae bacterium]
MTEPRWLDAREQRAWRGLREMEMRLGAEVGRRLAAASGLSVQDYGVLVVLTSQPDGSIRSYELAARLGWEKSRLSHHIGRMQRRGLVTKQRCEVDRRGWFVAITPQGRSEIEAAAPGHLEDVRELFVDLLEPAQLDVLGDITETVLAHLDALSTDDERTEASR